MKKLLFLLLVLGVIALVGCAPVQPGTSREGALAGKAVDLGPSTVAVKSCTDLGSGKLEVVDESGVVEYWSPRCIEESSIAINGFTCLNPTTVRFFSQQCESALGEVCQNGRCVVMGLCRVERRCGNGIVQPSRWDLSQHEECDDGNNINGDGCDSNCDLELPSICGNGICEPPENNYQSLNYCSGDCPLCS